MGLCSLFKLHLFLVGLNSKLLHFSSDKHSHSHLEMQSYNFIKVNAVVMINNLQGLGEIIKVLESSAYNISLQDLFRDHRGEDTASPVSIRPDDVAVLPYRFSTFQ